jgi:resuscitation-promoting factor RpfA
MSRYSGQHRKPSSPIRGAKTLAGITTAGAVAAAPFALAGSAEAASANTWDRLAQCESSGNWAINTGNGFSGGLQFTPSTWRGFGGGQYASMAYRASRSEQIRVAEKVLDGQGWGAWPSCSRKLGLTRADAAGTPSVSRTSHRRALKHKVRYHSASYLRTHARWAAKKRATAHAAGQYVVRRGDTLSEIAATHHVRGGWRGLYVKNKRSIGSSPNVLRVGQRLAMPR